MSGKKIADLGGYGDNAIRDILCGSLKGKREAGELLFFNKDTSFVYPSPLWVEGLQREMGNEVAIRKITCMYHNYVSFINLIHAMASCLDYIIPNFTQIHEDRLALLRSIFCETFLRNKLDAKKSFYFSTRFEAIAKSLGLDQSLLKID
jgi:hypothetical protein